MNRRFTIRWPRCLQHPNIATVLDGGTTDEGHPYLVLTQKPWIVPLFGTRTLERFEENVGSLSLTLMNEDFEEIEAADFEVEGARYPEEHMRIVGR